MKRQSLRGKDGLDRIEWDDRNIQGWPHSHRRGWDVLVIEGGKWANGMKRVLAGELIRLE